MKTRHVMVLGAGVIGVTTAWYLRERGFDVTVIERRPLPACETSYANGGQISVNHAEPWANPHAPGKILSWLMRDDAPLLFRPRLDPAQWRWCLGFLRECLPGRTHANTIANVALGLHSRAELMRLADLLQIAFDCQQRGILQIFTSAAAFEGAGTAVEVMRSHGCAVSLVPPGQAREIEPALAATLPIAGATWAPDDLSGDAKLFTRALAERAAAAGVEFRFGIDIERLESDGARLTGVWSRDAEGGYRHLTADCYVLCLGPQSPLLLRGIGIDVPIYPAKGYSITLPISDPARAPHVSVTDEAHKVVFTRLGDHLRAAGTAELAGYDRRLNRLRLDAILDRVFDYFPGIGDRALARPWAGLRPATPSNTPLIGRSALDNLWLNTGHGTLGWTHACGSAELAASLIAGERPAISFPFYHG